MNTVIQITSTELAIGATITLLLGCVIGYACGLADFARVTCSARREGPRA